MDYKYKSLRMSMMGMPPDFVFIKATKTIDGANMRLIKMIAQRLKFRPKISIATSFSAAVKQSNNRETDISMVRLGYARHRFMHNDFIGPVGSYDLHLISGAPP